MEGEKTSVTHNLDAWITLTQLLETRVVPWSDKTIKKKCKESGFPHKVEGGRYYFQLSQVALWWKKQAGKTYGKAS